MGKKKGSVQDVIGENRPIVFENVTGKVDLRSKLAEIKNHDGVIGYILRNQNTAVVDLSEPARISDYALFSSATNEAASQLSGIFDLGEIRHVMVETKHMRMLSVDIGESRISVFMEKNADVDNILNKLQEV